jgi:hypothetical protein
MPLPAPRIHGASQPARGDVRGFGTVKHPEALAARRCFFMMDGAVSQFGLRTLLRIANRRVVVKLSAPKFVSWIISLVLGVLGLLGGVGVVPALAGLSFWLVVVGLALMLVATAISGL